MVVIFTHYNTTKHRSWTSPRHVLSISCDTGFVTVPGRSRKTISAPIEDVRASSRYTDCANFLHDYFDELDDNL